MAPSQPYGTLHTTCKRSYNSPSTTLLMRTLVIKISLMSLSTRAMPYSASTSSSLRSAGSSSGITHRISASRSAPAWTIQTVLASWSTTRQLSGTLQRHRYRLQRPGQATATLTRPCCRRTLHRWSPRKTIVRVASTSRRRSCPTTTHKARISSRWT